MGKNTKKITTKDILISLMFLLVLSISSFYLSDYNQSNDSLSEFLSEEDSIMTMGEQMSPYFDKYAAPLTSAAVGRGGGQGKPACKDGKDNDADGLIDYPADPGCTSPEDRDEYNAPQAEQPQCSDSVDNDGDGLVDLNDPGCSDANDNSEKGTMQCDNGIDDDNNGLIDYPNDPGCDSPGDNDESSVTAAFNDTFDIEGTIEETWPMSESLNPYWWVNSGAYFIKQGGIGMTVQGELAEGSKWQVKYAQNNPVDTDNGFHPQNIFRFVQRNAWQDLRQEAYYLITRDQFSSSPNRQGYNGLLLFNRYLDGNNLYYTGIRTDGAAVIKKKINGVYYTMAYKKIFPGTYNRDENPSLLPKNTWLGLRSEVVTNLDGTVDVRIYLDNGRTGDWQLVLTAKDDGNSFGGAAITNAGFAGIRTDFMDVEFEDYKISGS